jgi:hypothetical protein
MHSAAAAAAPTHPYIMCERCLVLSHPVNWEPRSSQALYIPYQQLLLQSQVFAAAA